MPRWRRKIDGRAAVCCRGCDGSHALRPILTRHAFCTFPVMTNPTQWEALMTEDSTDKQTAAACATRTEPEPVAYAPSSQRLIELARRVAASDCTVLIVGESGTGKEVLARFIHRRSPRGSQPFVAVNCAAIPENMLEAMLFGYE